MPADCGQQVSGLSAVALLHLIYELPLAMALAMALAVIAMKRWAIKALHPP